MEPYATIDEVMSDLERLFAQIPDHPVEHLKRQLGDQMKKKALASVMVKKMLLAEPGFPKMVTAQVDKGRALQVESGDPGSAHVLMLGFESIAHSTMSVFWRGLSPKEKIQEWLRRSWREGLDTTQRSFKLVIASGMCEQPVADKLFFAGYAGGSALGAAQTLGAYLFTQLPKDATTVLLPWLKSIARIRVTWVVYQNAIDRTFDALGAPHLFKARGRLQFRV